MKKIKTDELENTLKHASKDTLKEILDTVVETDFTKEFSKLMKEYNLSRSDLIKKTLLDRNYAYQIIQGTKKASKDKIIQLGLGLSCSLEEVNRLLKLSGNAPLYAKLKRDAVFILAFENGYSVMDTDHLLNQHNLESF